MADLGDNSTLNSLSVALRGLMERNNAISSNIANVSTPGYKSKSISFENALANAQGIAKNQKVPMQSTNNAHINASSRAANINNVKAEINVSETTIHQNGNNVDIDKEMVELAKTGMRFRAVSEMTKRHFNGLNRVINGN